MSSEYWFPWYPTAYKRDAGHLDLAADGAYRRLIDWYMETREPIKKDPIKLMRIIGCGPEQFGAVWPQIEGFFTLDNGFLHLKRCNIELDRQDAKNSQRSEAGRRSALKRSQQYQLLINDRSTTVQRPFNDLRDIQDSRVEKIDIDISLVDRPYSTAAPDGATVPHVNGATVVEHANGNGEDHGRGKRGARISADWQPSPGDIAFARKLGWADDEITKRADEFRDYWISASGKNAVKRDWSATWRNRVRTVEEFRSKSNGRGPGANRPRSGLVAAMRNVMPGASRGSD